MANANDNADEHLTEYVTVTIGDHLFGLPISRVQDVFVPDRLTRVPLAPPEVAGILNLRGRVVTAIDMRSRLDLGSAPAGPAGDGDRHRAQGRVLRAAGRFGRRGDAASRTAPARRSRPISTPRLARVAAGIYRLEGQLLVVLDVDRVLDIENGAVAA